MNGPILIQGAMGVELEQLLSQMQKTVLREQGGYRFWCGTLNGRAVVLSQTGIGTIHCAAATVLGILNYAPSVVINQGIAGASGEDLQVGDIVVGASCIHINDLITPARGRGEGTHPFSWSFHDHTDGQEPLVLSSDPAWVKRLERAVYAGGNKLVGRLGSGDVFSREYDRIAWLREEAGHLCEDMESIATYRVCARLHIPCVGLRIISNNELTGEPYQPTVALALQRFLLDTI